jgi:thiosulfate reductase cytochrome b subunit
MEKPKMIYLNPLTVRIWHWIHATGIATLCITGAQIRFPEYINLFGYRTAVLIHDFTGIFVCLDWLLWFFYYVFIDKSLINPMQKGAYLMIMLTLVPIILVSGLLLLLITQKWMVFLGGVKIVIGLHFLVACCFAAFLFVHMYLATLGHTFWAHIITMITGWEEEVEDH